ncbi:hypothetical protein [Maribacter sp. 2210JD10-5]|uniref:hypothetical protein n=1 Tax=Maribacter sp. 2210JD10-5 TaxID=3386272 RepID=UPI0039BD60CE
MKTDYIEFKKQRELGDVLSDSFGFLRSQFKPLLTTFFKIVSPYILIMLISSGLYFYVLNSIFDFNIESPNEFYSVLLTIVLVISVIISAIVTIIMSQSSILYFIESYIDNNGKTHFSEIKKKVYQNFWNFFGLFSLFVLSVGIGILFCCIPGIFLYVPLSLAFAVYAFSKKGVIESYNYCFKLVKDEWWITFATLLIIGIIIAVAGIALSMPATMYSWIKVITSAGEYDAESTPFSIFLDPIYIILYLASIIFRFVLNIIIIIAGAFIYFNLNEKKNFTGTYERIDNLGEIRDN